MTTTEDERTPWQIARDNAERAGAFPPSWGPYHRHFANDAVHRDGKPECDQPGTPRRVYVFDPDALDEHERHVAAYAAEHTSTLPLAVRAPEIGELLAAIQREALKPPLEPYERSDVIAELTTQWLDAHGYEMGQPAQPTEDYPVRYLHYDG